MKKRVLSMLLAFILCFSTLPMTTSAQETDAVTVQEVQNSGNTAEVDTSDDITMQDISGGDSGSNIADETGKNTTGGGTTAEDIGKQDTGKDTEKDPAVQAVQALIDALPENVTADNMEALSEQLEAIEAAMAELTEEQTDQLDMARYAALCTAAVALTAEQSGEKHTHYLCGETTCNEVGGHKDSEITFTKLWMNGTTLTIGDDTAVGVKNIDNQITVGDCYVLPEGNYYLEDDITLDHPLYIGEESKTVNLCLNGKTITADGNFNDIIIYRYINAATTFSLTDCQNSGKITHANGKNGYGVYMYSANAATFKMYGGTISGNRTSTSASINGGGVCMAAATNYSGYGSVFYMYGGTITDNTASGNGGGVYVNNATNNRFYMYGGTIKNNSAANGGGVYSDGGNIEITDGLIENNTATNNGGGVSIGSMSTVDFTMSGGSIENNNAGTNGGGMYVGSTGRVTMSSAVTITGNKVNSDANNVYLITNKLITVASDLNGASIGVTTEKTPETGNFTKVAVGSTNHSLTDEDEKAFSPDAGSSYTIAQTNGAIILKKAGDDTLHYHPVCGEECTHLKADGTPEHESIYWEGVSELSNNMPAGYYYLTDDVELTKTWAPYYDVALDLNGHDIDVMESYTDAITLRGNASGATFTLADCRGGNKDHEYGKITHGTAGNGTKYTGAGIVSDVGDYYNYFTFNMYGGSISGNTSRTGLGYSGGVQFYKSSQYNDRNTFNMYDGEIVNNTSTYSNGGGGVGLSGYCTFNMYGGTIHNNKNIYSNGNGAGGVIFSGESIFNMVGGEITGNSATGSNSVGGVYNLDDGTMTVGGTARITGNTGANDVVSNVYLPAGKTLTVNKALTDTAKIGVTTAENIKGNYVVIAKGTDDYPLTDMDMASFSSDANYASKLSDNSILFIDDGLHEHPICGATCNHTGDKHEDLVWTGISSLDEIKANGNYYLTDDIKLTQVWTPDNNVNLCLNGHKIEYTPAQKNSDKDNYAIYVKKGVTVSLCDAHGSGTVISAPDNGIWCNGGTFNLYDGVKLSADNDGVYIDEAGHFNMYGGTVTGKSRGVTVVNSYFAMHGGEISGSKNYGGVYVSGDNKPQFIMTGGKICNNESSQSEGYGGGVTVSPGKNGPGIFTMTGGEISNNKALFYGGGVNIGCSGTDYFYPGSFTMTGGTISGNTATENGGGVYVATNNSSKNTKMITVGGNAKITGNTGSNVYLCDNNTIAIDEDGLKDDARIGVTTAVKPTVDNKIRIASNAKDDLKYTEIFTSDVTDENYTIVKDGTDLYLAAHEHSWVYTGNGAVITAKCSGCDEKGGSVTLVPPKKRVYDGNNKIAYIYFSEDWRGPAEFGTIDVHYKTKEGIDLAGTPPVNAGTYIASISIKGADNKPVTASVEYTIQKATLTVTAGNYIITYGENPEDAVKASATFEGFANDADQKALEFTPKYTYDYTQYGNVGDYAITPGVPDGLKLDEKLPNYDVKLVPGKLTVTPYPVILDWKNIENRTYGDGQGAIKGVVYCLEHDSGLVSAEIEGADLTAGTHTARVTRLTGEKAGNYTLPENQTYTYTVAKAKQTLEFKATATEVTYDENIIIDNELKETSNYSTNVIYDSSNPKVVTVDKDGSSHVVGVGIATITATAVETENYERAQATCTVTVTPKPVTISGIKVQNKTYDGTTAASIDLSNAKIDGGVSYTLQIDATNAKAVFEDANAGTDKTVTFTGFALTGADAGNYELSKQPDNVKADITRATITVTPEADQAKTYRENDPASLAYTASGAISGEKPSFTGVLGREAGENVGSYAIGKGTLELTDNSDGNFRADNYMLKVSDNVNFVINKATPVIKVTDKTLVKNGNAVDISTWASFDNTDAGAKLIYELADAYEGITLEDNKLTAVNADTTAESFVMTVTAGATTNFTAPEEKRFNVKVVEKEDAEVKIDAPTTKTYGDADFTLKATIKAADNGTWSWESSNDSVLKIVDGADTATPTIQVGSADADGATLTATYSSDAYYGTAFVTIKVAPKAITADMISEIPAQKYTGKAIQPVPYVTDDEIALVSGKDFELSYSDNNINVGTATVTITGSGNYTGKQDKSFAIEPKSIDGAEITLVFPSFEYNGSEQTVEIVSVTLPDGTVLAESDYKIKDDSNKATNAAPDLLLTIEGTGNYTGIATRYWMISKIDPKQADFDMVPDLSAEQTYSGEAQIVNVTTKSGIRGMGAVTVRYNGRTEAPTNVGSYAITIDVADGSNYKAISGIEAGTLTIKKAAAPTLADVKVDHAYATTGAQTVSLADLVAGATDYKLGEIAENETITGETVSENGVVTYTLTGKGAAGSTVTIPVTITSTNYEETPVNIVIAIKQATPTGAPGYEFLHDSSKTLKDAGLDLINSTLNPKEGTLEWIDSNGKVLPGETKLEEGKKYIWRFTPDDPNYATITGELELYAPYRILDGADSTWTQSTDGTIAIRGNGDFEKFQSVKVDGAVVDAKNYTVAKGSTIITFKEDYLKTLSTGSHTFELVWTDGSAATKFTIAAKPDNGDNNNDSNDDSDNDITVNGNVSSGNNTVPAAIDAPKTGDASGIWMTLFAVSLAGLAAMLVRKKNNRE